MNANTNASQNQKSSIIDHQSSIPNPLVTYIASLAEIADIFELPTTPPPPISQLRSLLDQRIHQLESEFQQRDPSSPDLETHRATYQRSRTRIWAKILQLNEAHRQTIGLNLPTEFPLPAIPQPAPEKDEPTQNHPSPVPTPSDDHAPTVPEPSQNRAQTVPNPCAPEPDPSKPTSCEPPTAKIPPATTTPPSPAKPVAKRRISDPRETAPKSKPKYIRMDQLPDEAKCLIARYIDASGSDTYVAYQLEQLPPVGLGLKFTRQSIARFRRSQNAELIESRERLARRILNASIRDADNTDDYREAALLSFTARLFEAAIDPHCLLKDIPSLASALYKLHATQIAERKLALKEQPASGPKSAPAQ